MARSHKGTAEDFALIPTVGGSSLKSALSLVKGDVALGNVDNTADSAKPVSAAQLATFLRSAYPISGYYQWTPFPVRTTTAAFPLNRLISSPFLVPVACTLDRIGINVTAFGATGAVHRLGIYNDDGNGRPGTLLLDAGQVSTAASNGWKEITISQALAVGLYHLAAVAQAQTSTVTTNGDGNSTAGLPGASSGAGLVNGCLVDSISGALPNPFGFTNTTTQSHRVGARYA